MGDDGEKERGREAEMGSKKAGDVGVMTGERMQESMKIVYDMTG